MHHQCTTGTAGIVGSLALQSFIKQFQFQDKAMKAQRVHTASISG